MSTLRLKYDQVPQTYLKHARSMTQKIKFVKLYFKKFCHTKAVGDRVFL